MTPRREWVVRKGRIRTSFAYYDAAREYARAVLGTLWLARRISGRTHWEQCAI